VVKVSFVKFPQVSMMDHVLTALKDKPTNTLLQNKTSLLKVTTFNKTSSSTARLAQLVQKYEKKW